MKKVDTNKNTHPAKDTFPPPLAEIWDLTGSADKDLFITEQETEQALHNVLNQLPPETGNTSSLRHYFKFAVAASVLLVAFISYFSIYQHTYVAPAGEKTMITLSDGSVLWLNGNSEISHKPLFGITHRTLTMNGEVYFDVKKGTRPFNIRGPHLSTTVLGTSFSISDWQNSNYLHPAVVVSEGTVEVSNNRSENVILKQAEKLDLNLKNGSISRSVTDAYDSDWRNEGLIFHDATLPVFFERLQNHYDMPISVSGELSTQRIEAHYQPGKSLEQILTDVAVVKDITIRRSNKGYVITP